jgi:hypothetical protein
MKKRLTYVIGLIILSYMLVSCCSKNNESIKPNPEITRSSSGEETDSGINIGNDIIKAVENYYDDYGYYPNTLLDLIPIYIQLIPTTTTNQKFIYIKLTPSSGNGWSDYILSFELISKNGYGCSYHSGNRLWECGRNEAP